MKLSVACVIIPYCHLSCIGFAASSDEGSQSTAITQFTLCGRKGETKRLAYDGCEAYKLFVAFVGVDAHFLPTSRLSALVWSGRRYTSEGVVKITGVIVPAVCFTDWTWKSTIRVFASINKSVLFILTTVLLILFR